MNHPEHSIVTCNECNKATHGCLNAMQDFRGNTFTFCCNTCQKRIKKMLDKLFAKYGGRKDENGIVICSCAYSPAITSTKELTLEIM